MSAYDPKRVIKTRFFFNYFNVPCHFGFPTLSVRCSLLFTPSPLAPGLDQRASSGLPTAYSPRLAQRLVTAPGRDFMRRAASFGKARAASAAQSMENAILRQACFVAPRPELLTELGCAEWAARGLRQERQMAARRRIDDRLKLGAHRNANRVPGFALPNLKSPVVNVLRSHADDVAKTLHAVEAKSETKTSGRADRMRALELRNLGVGPSAPTFGLCLWPSDEQLKKICF
jgi:hypothetical protein